MADITFFAATAQVAEKLRKLTYDGSTVSVDSSIAGIQTVIQGGLVRDQEGKLYYAEGTVTDDIKKYGTDLVIDATWGTAPAGTITTPDGNLLSISADSSGNLAIVQATNAGGDNVNVRYFNSSGTEVWTVLLGATAVSCKFHPNGRLFVGYMGIAVSGTCMVELSATDGSVLQSYTAPHASGTYAVRSVDIDNINDVVYVGADLVVVTTYTGLITKWARGTAAKVWNVDYGGGGRPSDSARVLVHSNGSVYAKFVNNNSFVQTYDVVKVAASDGTVEGTYLTHSGTDLANAYDIIEFSNGEIVVDGGIETNGDGTYAVWILSEALAFSAGWANNGINDVVGLAAGADTPAAIVPPADLKYNKQLVAIANDEVWHEPSAGTMAVIAEAVNSLSGLDVTVGLAAVEAFQKVFIANAAALKVTEFSNTRMLVSNLATSVTPPFGALLTNSVNETIVVDAIQRINSTTVSALYGFVTTSTGFADGDKLSHNGVSIVVVDSVTGPSLPLFHDYTVYPNISTTPLSFGSLPGKATLIALYRGRIVLAGNPARPFQWYMARQNNPYDFAYFANDPQSPVAGGNADAGELGDTVTALIPYKDDYLVFGCTNTIWVMRGDAAAGGSLDEVSLTTGIFGPMSHCWDDKDNLYFFGSGGIYRIPPGFGPPENLTAGVLPNIITDLGVDPSTHRVVLVYDRRRLGILIAITTLTTGANINYWFDLITQGFFPETYPTENAVYAATFYGAQDSDYRRLLVGGADGFIRFFDDSAKDDDVGLVDKAINSYVTFGPVQLAQDADSEGKIISLTIITGTDTDGLKYDVFVADTAEETIDAAEAGSTPFLTDTVQVDNRIAKIRIKCRGIYALIKLSNNTATQAWGIEKAVIEVTEGGRR